MKITNIEAIYPNYALSSKLPGGWRTHLWQIVVKIETDVGVTGYGYGGGGKAALPIINGHWRPLLTDMSVDSVADISQIWSLLYDESIPYGRGGVAMMALSGVDLALWDLLGKAEKMPVYQLIQQARPQAVSNNRTNNPREKIRTYASGLDSAYYAEQGFTAHKMVHRWHPDTSAQDYELAIERAETARAVFGEEALLMFDCYMSWDSDVTTEMAKELAAYNLYWFEDVLTPDLLIQQAALRPEIKPVLLAGGEHAFRFDEFMQMAILRALDIWQPDVTWCGGITALLRIIELAEDRDVGTQVVLHRGGEVWGLHVIAATMNARNKNSGCQPLAEILAEERRPHVTQLWLDQPSIEKGYITVSDAPGFGVVLNEAMI